MAHGAAEASSEDRTALTRRRDGSEIHEVAAEGEPDVRSSRRVRSTEGDLHGAAGAKIRAGEPAPREDVPRTGDRSAKRHRGLDPGFRRAAQEEAGEDHSLPTR